MSAAIERAVQQKITRYFIEANPLKIVLVPQVSARTASGGVHKTDGTPRAAQRLRLIDQSSAAGNSPGLSRTTDGAERKATHQLLGETGALMAVDDYWLADGGRYVITEMLPDNGYETRALVTFHGR